MSLLQISDDELIVESEKSDSSRERDRFSVELIQMAKELVLFCRDTIIAHGKAMSHRATFAPQVIRNIKAPTTRAEDRIIELEEFISSATLQFGPSVREVKRAAGLTIDAVRGLLTKLNTAAGLVTEASLETSWLKVKHAVTLLIDNVDKWIIAEQEKELAHQQSDSTSPSSQTAQSSAASSTPSVNRLILEVRTATDTLMSFIQSSASSSATDGEMSSDDDDRFLDLSKQCALALNDLVIAAKRLGLTTDATALREANFLLLASAKLYYHTQTDGSLKDLQKQREQLEVVLQRMSDPGTTMTSPRVLFANLPTPPPKVKTKQQELKEMVIQRSRAESISMAGVFADLPISGRAQQGILKIRAVQRLVRNRIAVHKWRNLVEEYAKSNASATSRKRFKCFWEITTSEKTYFAALKIALEVWMPPLRKGAVKNVGDAEVDRLFLNMQTLVESSRNLIAEVNKRAAQYPVTQSIGDIFLKLGPWFRLYGPYVNNFDAATTLLKQLAKRSGWNAYVSQCVKEAPGKTELGSYLIMPVQRIPRYELLLKTLIGFTPEDHVDYSNLNHALAMIKDINDKIDTMQLSDARHAGPLPLAQPPQFVSGHLRASAPVIGTTSAAATAPTVTFGGSVVIPERGNVIEKERSGGSGISKQQAITVGASRVPRRDSGGARDFIVHANPNTNSSSSVSANGSSPVGSPPPTTASPATSLTRVNSMPLHSPAPNNISPPTSPNPSSGTSSASSTGPPPAAPPARVMSAALAGRGYSNIPGVSSLPPPPVRPLSAVSPSTASLSVSADGLSAPSSRPPKFPLPARVLSASADRSSGGSNGSNSLSGSSNSSPARTDTPPKPSLALSLPVTHITTANPTFVATPSSVLAALPPPPPSPLSGLHQLKAIASSSAQQASGGAIPAIGKASSPRRSLVSSINNIGSEEPQSSAQMKPGAIVCVLPGYKNVREARVHMKVDKMLIMLKRTLISKEVVFDFEQEIVFQEGLSIQENVPNLGDFSFGFALANENGLCTFYCRNQVERESYLNRINGVIKRYQLKAMLEEVTPVLHNAAHAGARHQHLPAGLANEIKVGGKKK